MGMHPLDGKNLRDVLLGYEHLSSFWKAELYWANALKFIGAKQAEGADEEVLLFSGLGPLFFMAEFSDLSNLLEGLEPVLFERIVDSAAEYRDFMGDDFVRDNLPWSSEDDLKTYLDMFSEWLQENSPKLPDFSGLDAVLMAVWKPEKTTV